MISKKTGLFLKKLSAKGNNCFRRTIAEPMYFDLRDTRPDQPDKTLIYEWEKAARILRGLIFVMLEKRRNGHPGGSSAKVEQLLALTLGGRIKFDLLNPKHPGRDRVVWSAGHCTPLLYSSLALYYEALRRIGREISLVGNHAVFPEDLLNFRHPDGLPGHAESGYPLSDFSTGPSGHGLSAAGGLSILHKSVGLKTKIWVLMGDAESEEGMTFEARNILSATGMDNLVVCLDYNRYGIDGPVNEVISRDYVDYWLSLGWNVIEADGHNLAELHIAYELAENGWGNHLPTVVIAHTRKGYGYGSLADSHKSHGEILSTIDYQRAMADLGFTVKGGENCGEDLRVVISALDDNLLPIILQALRQGADKILPENTAVDLIKRGVGQRKLVSPTAVKRPKKLPATLLFKPGEKVSMRAAAGEWFKWLMENSAFFYAGAGDLSGSTGTAAAEKVFGLINKKNPYGRGIRFGIAEQNMAMMMSALSQDILPGGFKPATVFGTYAVFSQIIANAIHLTVYDAMIRRQHGFFIFLATHVGPETGEDGPTHQGIFWQSLYRVFPGIKVYAPLDASETVEMLFFALQIGEPIVLTLPREKTMVFDRGVGCEATRANQGAYIFQDYQKNRLPKKVVVVSGAKMLVNVLSASRDLMQNYNIKIVAVSSPELFVEYRRVNPMQATQILSDEEKKSAIVFHNGSLDFIADLLLTDKERSRRFGVEKFLFSGTADEVYAGAGFSVEQIKDKIIKTV